MEDLKIVRLKEAAALLHATPQTVRIKARAGLIPGRKVGKHWIFSLDALHRYLCGEWEPRVTQGEGKETEACRSLNEVRVPTGITSCTRLEGESRYKAALAPTTNPKRRNTTTD